jgi:anti-sigma factor RsiW
MSHLDEGTLHALLDGELDLRQVAEVQTHLGSCVACGSRLQEVKQFLAEADRLVGALEVPAGATASPPPPQSRQSPPFGHPIRDPESWDELPVLLLPDSGDALARRRRWFAMLRWAAIITVVVGGGRVLLGVIRPGNSLPVARDIATTARPTPPPVVSPEETARPEQPAVAAAPRASRPPASNRTPAGKARETAKVAAAAPLVDSSLERSDTQADTFADSAVPETGLLAAAQRAESISTDSVARDSEAKDTPRAEDDLATRRAAAVALAELDRQRVRQRAAAATAALPPPAPARTEAAPAAEAAPAPRTPEQRAQIYLRIGLDEANKQLGRPVHVIEGMTPEFMGLTYGRLVAGADPNRPVVRVVYLDSRGRMILLDQQRMRAGQAPGAAEGNLRWSIGDVMLYLRGEPGPDVLRNLQRRVR